MLTINLKDNAARSALIVDRILQRMSETERESVINMLWFDYIGRNFDWRYVRLSPSCANSEKKSQE